MTRIEDFLGAPRAQVHQNPTPPPRPETPIRQEEMTDDTIEQEYQEFEHIPRVARSPPMVLVNRNQDPDQEVQQVRHDAAMWEQNLEAIVERIIVRNRVSPCLQRPTYSSPLPDFVLQTKLPRGWKVPKFTTFAGDTKESTVEHMARYQTEAGDIANNEDLKLKYFPSSLTKNAFTWSTMLPPQSIQTWTQLERLFHEQFYMGQSKVSLKELARIKRKVDESVDQYLNKFRLLKARCFTQVPEHELVEMVVGGLDYSIRKKMDTQYLRDMAQLADRVRRIERLKAEKSKVGRYHKKEKVSYIAVEGGSSDDEDIIDKSEVNMEELKPEPSYACKVLKPSNGKNPLGAERTDKYVAKTYTFDVSKCDEIFDLLVKDGQIIVPQGLKDPPLEQKKKMGFCKFHNFLGHKTHQCVLFRDLVLKALKEERFQFGERPKMQVDYDPLKVEEALYAEPPECMMVDTNNGLIEVLNTTSLAESFEVMMVETTEGFGNKDQRRPESAYP
ncbi:uncharacterized protein LOC127103431 [Lathyrus oleraceus]|uniref:uncharacterized protein LOC127103431 n=1 Tax=Pisum sativum TaxID=3888 RepID=UPI0021CE37EC|nr:uncharacterized protein LOC127103431 [Pisum sativum]